MQKKLFGTGYAAKLFLKYKKNKFNNLIILLADTPFINISDINKIKKLIKNDLVVFGFKNKQNMSYGLIQKDKMKKKKKLLSIRMQVLMKKFIYAIPVLWE